MTQIIDSTGFIAETWPEDGVTLDFDNLWTGQDLPIEQPLAVRFEIGMEPENLSPWFHKVAMVILPFGTSADGRGFSLARKLRQLGYTGVIRAEGHILVDQFRAALRVGIDQVAISDEQATRNPAHQWLAVNHAPGYQAALFAAE
ncbi:DUF934 domain-containing protein [Oceanibium sediminis]|uniref:DUF934 domain-containing protein n=1 Tax=Oceanibium sediminis TaxID=2026339 RepID=UPI00130087E6|nr:DUF934 domain-containing protein [Oceanibium sediminis]